MKTLKVNVDLENVSDYFLRTHKKELKYLLSEAEKYNSCPAWAVRKLRNELEYITKRLRRVK